MARTLASVRLLGIVACLLVLLPPTEPALAAGFVVNSTVDEPDATPGDGQCVSTPSGVCTLRAAVMEANSLGGNQLIQVPTGVYQLTIDGGDDTAAAGDLDVTGDLHLVGAGSASTFIRAGTSAASAIDRVIDVRTGGTLHLDSVTVRFGKPTIGAGGGIESFGSLSLDGVVVSDNLETGIYGDVTMTNSMVTRNALPGRPRWGDSWWHRATLIEHGLSQQRSGGRRHSCINGDVDQ